MTPGPLGFVRRVVSDKRTLVGLVAIGLIVDAGLYGLAVYPWTVRVASAERRAQTAAAGLAAARQRLESSSLAADDRNRMERELRAFRQDILPPDLAGARSLTLARLAALADEHGLVMERRASLTDQEDDSHLARLQVSMLLRGAYRDIRRFIYAIETAPQFLIIDEIVLSQGDEAEAGEVLGLGLSTYHWRSDNDGNGPREPAP